MPSHQQNFVPWVLAIGMFVIGTTSLSILGIGPELTQDIGVTPSAAGWLVTAFAATFALAAPAAQFWLSRRLAQRTLILVGASLLSVTLIATAFANTLTLLLMCRVGSAIGGALIAPTSTALSISLVPTERRGAVLAIVFGGFTLATVAGVPVATWLALSLGWRGAMGAIGLIALVFFCLALWVLPSGTTSKVSLPPNSRPLPIGRTAQLLSVTGCVLAAQFIIYALMGEVLTTHAGLPSDWLPTAILLFGVSGLLGNIAAGAGSVRFGPVLLVWVSLVILALALLALFAPLAGWWAALCLAGCAFGGTLFATPQQNLLVNETPNDQHGVVLALNSSANYVGIATGSAAASALASGFGLGSLAPTALIVLAAAALLHRVIHRSTQANR